MLPNRNVGGRDRIVRAVFALVFAVLAVRKLRTGDRTVGTLAALGALGLGFNVTARFCGLNALVGIDTTNDD